MTRRLISGAIALILMLAPLIASSRSLAQAPDYPLENANLLPFLPGPASYSSPTVFKDPGRNCSEGLANCLDNRAQPFFARSPDRLSALPQSVISAGFRALGAESDPFALFEPYVVFDEARAAQAVGIGDLNGDGRNDVVVSSGGLENALYVYTQTLTGTLATPITYTTGLQPDVLVIGDLNNDNRDDLAVAHLAEDTLGVYLQNTAGALDSPAIYPTGDGPNALAIGDLNGDGLEDLAVSHWFTATIGIFTQTPGGVLAPMSSHAAPLAGWDDLAVGDLNGDGRSDLAKLNGQFVDNPTLSIWLQTDLGSLDPPLSHDLEGVVGNGLAVADVNSDGRSDAVFSQGGNRPFSELTVITQTLTGALGISMTYTAYDTPESVEIADLNLDGRLDVAVAHGGWAAVSVYLQGADGQLEPFDLYELPAPGAAHFGPRALAIGDLNSDGLPDIAIADQVNGLVILYHRPALQLLYMPFSATDFAETPTPVLDDFSDPDSGWPIIRSVLADFIYQDGEYRMANKVPYTAALVTAQHNLRDLDLTVSGRNVGGVDGAYGIGFGFLDNPPVPTYFAFIVWPDFQEWNLIHFTEGQFAAVFWGVSSAIETGNTPNRLRVLRQGDFFSLTINWVPVFSANYPTYSGARLTGLVQAPLDIGHDARFDDYELRSP